MDNKIYTVWLSTLMGVGTITIKSLYERFGNSENIYNLTASEIEEIDFISKNQKLALKNKNLDYAKSIIEDCENKEIKIIGFNDEDYPQSLKNIDDPHSPHPYSPSSGSKYIWIFFWGDQFLTI